MKVFSLVPVTVDLDSNPYNCPAILAQHRIPYETTKIGAPYLWEAKLSLWFSINNPCQVIEFYVRNGDSQIQPTRLDHNSPLKIHFLLRRV
jgi:hypothetical protein